MIPAETKKRKINKVELSITGIADYEEERRIYIFKASAKFLFWFGLKKDFLQLF